MTALPNNQPLLLWDGDCGFCARSVIVLRRLNRRGWFRDVPSRECPSPPMNERLMTRCEREVVLLTPDGAELGGARAVFMCLARGGGWFTALIGRFMAQPPMIWLADVVYRIVARNRAAISRAVIRRGAACGMSHDQEEDREAA